LHNLTPVSHTVRLNQHVVLETAIASLTHKIPDWPYCIHNLLTGISKIIKH